MQLEGHEKKIVGNISETHEPFSRINDQLNVELQGIGRINDQLNVQLRGVGKYFMQDVFLASHLYNTILIIYFYQKQWANNFLF